MAKKYTKEQAERALEFWKNALNESIAAESEEDQAKEKEGTDEVADDPKDAEIEELKAKVAELEAALAAKDGAEDSAEAGEKASEEGSEDADDEGFDEETEEDSEDEEAEDEEAEDEEAEDEEESEEEIDEAAPGSAKFAPNTVGAVCELLKKSDPNDVLVIQLLPAKEQCMITDIDRKISMSGGVTYMEIAKGAPLVEGCCGCKKSKKAKK